MGFCRMHDRKKASKEDSPRARVEPKEPRQGNPGELEPVTLIGAIAAAALLKLRAPLRFHLAASRLALPASHVQLAAARSTEPALPPR